MMHQLRGKLWLVTQLFACCALQTFAREGKGLGMAYAPIPMRTPGGKINNDDMFADWGRAIWGPDGRDDLGLLHAMGIERVHLYGCDVTRSHKAFLDRAHELGIRVWVGLSNYLYEGSGSYNSESGCYYNRFNCYHIVKKAYRKLLESGVAVGREYHPAVETIMLANEPDLTACGALEEPIQPTWCNWSGTVLKAMISAWDGMLDAERDLGVQPSVNISVAFSGAPAIWAVDGSRPCDHYKMPERTFPIPLYNKTYTKHPCVATPGMVNLYLAVKGEWFDVIYDPKMLEDPQFIPMVPPYTTRNNLHDSYRARWVHSFNTGMSTNYVEQILQDYRDYVWKGYSEATPVAVAEFNPSMSQRYNLRQGIYEMKRLLDESFVSQIFIFEFQVSVWKAFWDDGITQLNFGLFSLGDRVLGQTGRICKDPDNCDTYNVRCLEDDRFLAEAVAIANNKAMPNHTALCKNHTYHNNSGMLDWTKLRTPRWSGRADYMMVETQGLSITVFGGLDGANNNNILKDSWRTPVGKLDSWDMVSHMPKDTDGHAETFQIAQSAGLVWNTHLSTYIVIVGGRVGDSSSGSMWFRRLRNMNLAEDCNGCRSTTWIEWSPAESFKPRLGHAVTVANNVNGSELILFGGSSGPPECSSGSPKSEVFGDTWALKEVSNITMGRWNQIASGIKGLNGLASSTRQLLGSNSPSPRMFHMMTAVGKPASDGDVVLLMGGIDQNCERLSDVWMLERRPHGQQWQKLADAAPWEPRSRASLVALGERKVLLGGDGSKDGALDDFWLLDILWPSSTTATTACLQWTGGASLTLPSGRAGHSAVVMNQPEGVILAGGQDNDGNYLNDAWLLELDQVRRLSSLTNEEKNSIWLQAVVMSMLILVGSVAWFMASTADQRFLPIMRLSDQDLSFLPSVKFRVLLIFAVLPIIDTCGLLFMIASFLQARWISWSIMLTISGLMPSLLMGLEMRRARSSRRLTIWGVLQIFPAMRLWQALSGREEVDALLSDRQLTVALKVSSIFKKLPRVLAQVFLISFNYMRPTLTRYFQPGEACSEVLERELRNWQLINEQSWFTCSTKTSSCPYISVHSECTQLAVTCETPWYNGVALVITTMSLSFGIFGVRKLASDGMFTNAGWTLFPITTFEVMSRGLMGAYLLLLPVFLDINMSGAGIGKDLLLWTVKLMLLLALGIVFRARHMEVFPGVALCALLSVLLKPADAAATTCFVAVLLLSLEQRVQHFTGGSSLLTLVSAALGAMLALVCHLLSHLLYVLVASTAQSILLALAVVLVLGLACSMERRACIHAMWSSLFMAPERSPSGAASLQQLLSVPIVELAIVAGMSEQLPWTLPASAQVLLCFAMLMQTLVLATWWVFSLRTVAPWRPVVGMLVVSGVVMGLACVMRVWLHSSIMCMAWAVSVVILPSLMCSIFITASHTVTSSAATPSQPAELALG